MSDSLGGCFSEILVWLFLSLLIVSCEKCIHYLDEAEMRLHEYFQETMDEIQFNARELQRKQEAEKAEAEAGAATEEPSDQPSLMEKAEKFIQKGKEKVDEIVETYLNPKTSETSEPAEEAEMAEETEAAEEAESEESSEEKTPENKETLLEKGKNFYKDLKEKFIKKE